MLALVPQSLLGLDDEALAIISKIICTQFKECNQRRSEAIKEARDKKEWRWIRKGNPRRNEVFGMYAKIHSKELQNIVHRYKPICDELEKKNVIRVNSKYSSDRFPKSYALARQYWNDKLIIHDIGLCANTYIYGNVHTYQGSFQDQYKLCESHIRNFRLPLCSIGKLNSLYDEMENDGKTWADFGKSTVANISSRNWWSTVCRYGRYHTPLTILDREVRQCLVCHFDAVVGFDFKNFQPSLLKFYERTGVKRRIPSHEAKQYFELCKNGRLYEFLGEKFGKDNPYDTRAELKQDFCRMLNTKNKHMKTLPVFKCLSNVSQSWLKSFTKSKMASVKNHIRKWLNSFTG